MADKRKTIDLDTWHEVCRRRDAGQPLPRLARQFGAFQRAGHHHVGEQQVGSTPRGQRIVSILLLEDLAIVPLLAVVAVLATSVGTAAESSTPLWQTIGLAAAAVGGALEGGVLLTLFSISGTLETRAMGKARRAVEALMALRPDTALRLGPGGEVT